MYCINNNLYEFIYLEYLNDIILNKSHTFNDLFNYISKIIFLTNYKNVIEKLLLKSKNKNFEPQEAILRFLTWFNCIKKLENMIMIKGCFNKNEMNPYENTGDFFKSKLKAGSDASDLTLYNQDKKYYVVITSKNYKKVGYTKLDIGNIIAQDAFKEYDVKIGIIVRDEILNNKKSTENYIKLIDNNYKFTQKDLLNGIRLFKKKFLNNEININLSEKIKFNKRFHQEWTIEKTKDLMNKNVKHIIWGHVARSGKTYMMMFLIQKLLKTKNNLKVMIATPVPSETLIQYKETFYNILDKNVIDIVVSSEYKTSENTQNEKAVLLITSIQLLKNKTNMELKNTFINMDYDLIFIDEAHYGGITEKTISSIKSFNMNNNAVWIYVTATYLKPKICKDIQDILTWNMMDIGFIKNMQIDKLKKYKNDNLFNQILDKYNINNLKLEYEIVPKMNITALKIDESKINQIADTIDNYELDKGWCIDGLFDMYDKQFKNDTELFNVSVKIFKDTELQKSLISKCITHNDKIVIMVYLPLNSGIDTLQKLYERFLIDNNIVDSNKYDIMIMNSKDGDNPIKIKNYMKKIDLKKHLIVLCGNMCSMGLTIEQCDIVILMNSSRSYDNIYQKMYRCMTERQNKLCGYIIDIDMRRSIDMIVNMATHMNKHTSNVEQSLNSLFETDMINWQLESMNTKQINISAPDFIKMEWLKTTNIKKTINILLNDITCDKHYLKDLNKLIDGKAISNNDNIIKENILKNEDMDKIKKGTKIILNNDEDSDDEDEEELEEYDDTILKLDLKKVMEVVLPALGFITVYENTTFINSLDEELTTEKMKILKLMCMEKLFVSEEHSEQLLKILCEIYNNMDIETKTKIDTTLEIIRVEFKKTNGDLRRLSEMVDEYLVPTNNEKTKNAEVSTPRPLRIEMLMKLYEQLKYDFVKNTPRYNNICKTGIKIFEPCVGKGGFVVDIIALLMEALEDGIKDEELRYKHIIENCLYMSEINEWNVYIVEKMIKWKYPEMELKINMNVGDTLELDIKKKWGIEGMDVVIGNPPYNKDVNNRGSGHKLWDKFVEKTIDKFIKKDGYIVYVHPKGWRQVNNKTGKKMRNKSILYLNMNDVKEGMRQFKCNTDFDWYIIKNCSEQVETIINDYKNNITKYNLRNVEFIPNWNLEFVYKLIGNPTKIIYSRSNYGADKEWMRKEKNEEYKYPCVYSIGKNNNVNFRWSNTNEKGHFKENKIIVSASGYLVDKNGDYGMTQWAYGIKCDGDEFTRLEKVIKSDRFKEFIESVQITLEKYKILTVLKDDFWKEFE